jgi:hypothetical protein
MDTARNHAGRSILSAILFHVAYNFTVSLVYPVPEGLLLTGALLLLGAVLGIVIVWEPRTLTRRYPILP